MAAFTRSEKNYEREVQLLQVVIAHEPGWQRAYAAVVNTYRPYLFQRCVRHLRNAADAEDVLQEVFLNAYRFANRYQGRASLKTWLTTIANNQCNTFLRRRQRQTSVQHLLAEIDIDEAACAASAAQAEEQRLIVAKAMIKVSPTAREVLSLRYWLELPLEEIAQTLGIGLCATKMRLYRAHQQCYAAVESECYPA